MTMKTTKRCSQRAELFSIITCVALILVSIQIQQTPFLEVPENKQALWHPSDCFRHRFHGFWDAPTRSMRSFDPRCELQTLVQEPDYGNPQATRMNGPIREDLDEQLQGACILMLGDSTDRQITETWCPRLSKTTDLWMPKSTVSASGKIQNYKVFKAVQENGGHSCTTGSFTLGNYMHYGVSGGPYWKFAHMYQPIIPNNTLTWSDTTEDRIRNDVPQFFAECEARGHTDKYVVVQSYLWDLARQWYIFDTNRPPARMIQEWAVNTTRLVAQVRAAVPDAQVGWRYAGPMIPAKGRDPQAIYDMNLALAAVGMEDLVDFVADYGSVLSSEMTIKGPFPAHPPVLPLTAYFNLLLNAVVSLRQPRE